MIKKSMAWVLTLAMLLGMLSGLALVTSADSVPFALASYLSGAPLYKNATQQLDTVTEHGGSTPMASITGDPDARSAYYMTKQNDQLGIKIPVGSGINSNATIEVKFWADPRNNSDSRLGMNFTAGSLGKQSDYGSIVMSGANGAEKVALKNDVVDLVDSAVVTMADGTDLVETGWKVLKIELNDADFSNGGQVNFVNWGTGNQDDVSGWYVESILVYDTAEGRPGEAEIGIREDVIGYYDFSDSAEAKAESLLEVSADADGELTLTKESGYALTVTAKDGNQPAILATETAVTLMAELKEGADGEWKVVRVDLTGNDATSFDFGEKLFAGTVTADTISVKKVLVARTELIHIYENDAAFMDLDNPYSDYTDFQRVTKTTYRLAYDFEGEALAVADAEGRTAVVASDNNQYLRINVEDAFTMNGANPIADYRIEIEYLDKGTGDLNIHYNSQANEAGEYDVATNFKAAKVATLEDSGEWKTATVYLSDAEFRNAGNGNDFRVAMNNGLAVSAVKVSIGADKTELTQWANKAINTLKYTDTSVSNFTRMQTAAATVLENVYATKAQVDAALQNIKDAYDALALTETADNRFTLSDGTIWAGVTRTSDGEIVSSNGDGNSNGSIVKVDGWYCWAFPNAASGRYVGLAAEDGIFDESTSVTYEYEIMFDTTCGNDRCFMGFGSNTFGWTNVNDKPAQPNFNGYQAAGSWGKTPAIGRWGTIVLENPDFDPTLTSDVLTGAITTLGAWIDNDDKEANLYVRNIKVYDNDDPSKFIELSFKEDVTELIVTPTADVETSEVAGYDAYTLNADNKLNISTKEPIADGIVSKGENNVLVAVDYYLADCDNADEKVVLTYGEGKTMEIAHENLSFRNNWVRLSFKLTDANFGSVDNLVLSYENGSAMSVRGIRMYAINADGEMTSEKATKWGSALLDADAQDHAYYDWTTEKEDSYGMTVRFDEGEQTVQYLEDYGVRGVFAGDNKIYVTVDDSVVDDTVRYVRVDITHESDAEMYIEYNTVLPEGVDDSAEPYLSAYRFHCSAEGKSIHEVTDPVTGATSQSYAWDEDEYVYGNLAGAIVPTEEDTANITWKTSSIYLNETQFRNAANGDDFRIIMVSPSYISRIEVRAITEEEYKAAEEERNKVPEAEFELGDVNHDGKIDTTDARLTLQYAAKRIKEDKLDLSLADVNKSGEVDTTDARLILQYAAKRIKEFPQAK